MAGPEGPRGPQAGAGPPAPGAPAEDRNRRAVVALVLGNLGLLLLGLTLGWAFFVALPLGVAGLSLGAQARGRVVRGETTKRRSTAVTAMFAGALAILGSVAAVVYWFVRVTVELAG